jgi:hypothetical protein
VRRYRCLDEEQALGNLGVGKAASELDQNLPLASPYAFAPWPGFGILCGYTALVLALATVLLVRRDA